MNQFDSAITGQTIGAINLFVRAQNSAIPIIVEYIDNPIQYLSIATFIGAISSLLLKAKEVPVQKEKIKIG